MQRKGKIRWKHCKYMEVPESLKKNAFKQSGYIDHYQHGLFLSPSWLAVSVASEFPTAIPRRK